ncbi:hypothetical protein B296_00000970 [Ensete ventricosum]|uniref:Uncharacterized protein n=1 Tax=Ensete ventricosum TaxID=4639 RepID=A0A427B0X8_ENSVE|nr:hypothetical protein B296_00000970 [Ensete ventricosum]
MTLYITREASKVLPSHDPSVLLVFSFFATFLKPFLLLQLWRKVYVETSVELQLLAEKWKLLLAGLVFQVLIRFFFLVYPWAVCSRSSLSTSTWTNSSRSWVYDPSGVNLEKKEAISVKVYSPSSFCPLYWLVKCCGSLHSTLPSFLVLTIIVVRYLLSA